MSIVLVVGISAALLVRSAASQADVTDLQFDVVSVHENTGSVLAITS